MTKRSYSFAGEVQDDILRLMATDPVFSDASSYWVKPHYFEDKTRQWVARFLISFYEKYAMPPTFGQAETEINLQEGSGKLELSLSSVLRDAVSEIYKVPIAGAKEYTLEVVHKFARQQAWETAILSSIDYLKAGDLDKVDEIMSSAQADLTSLDDSGYWFFEAMEERLSRRGTAEEKQAIPIGTLELDMCLRRRGILPGEVALWVAEKGGGKSIGLAQVARRAIYGNNKVAYYSLEMSDEQNADRFDSGFSGVSMWDLEGDEDKLRKEMIKLAKRFPRSLLIKQFPTKSRTIEDIHRHLKAVKRRFRWQPRMIVVDYLTIVKPIMARSKRHEELTETIESFRGMAVEEDCVGWSAAQLNREGALKDTAEGTEIAGGWDTLATADHVYIINQSREERAENLLRILIDKSRDGVSKVEIGPLATDWARMCFIRMSRKTEEDLGKLMAMRRAEFSRK